MRTWRYIEPTSATDMTPVEHVLTENEILEQYYPWWARQMVNAGKVSGITPLGVHRGLRGRALG